MNKTREAGPRTTPERGTEWVGPPHGHLLHLEFGPETWRSSARVGDVPLYCSRMSIETDVTAADGLSVTRLEVPMLNAHGNRGGTAVYEGVLVEQAEYLEFVQWKVAKLRLDREL